MLKKQNIVNKHKRARESEVTKQQYNKQYADHRWNANTSEKKVGNFVPTATVQVDT
jgi:hypothetical protein